MYRELTFKINVLHRCQMTCSLFKTRTSIYIFKNEEKSMYDIFHQLFLLKTSTPV